jgi:hypothetical protein
MNFANRGSRRTRQYFSHDGASDDTGVFAPSVIFERYLNPALGHAWSPFARTRGRHSEFVEIAPVHCW